MSKVEENNLYPTIAQEESTKAPQQQPLLGGTEEQAQPAPQQQAAAANETTATSPETTVVVVNEPTPIYGPYPVDVQCPYCHNFCRTRLRHTPNSRTHLIALILCLFQLYCCICLPYCIGSCMDVNHYCGMCDRFLGTCKR